MSYPDTLSRLESQVLQLEGARIEEARERDRLRSEISRLNAALDIARTALLKVERISEVARAEITRAHQQLSKEG